MVDSPGIKGQEFDGNVFILIEKIFEEHSQTVNKDIQMQYGAIDVQNTEYEQELEQWKTDGKTLSTAGKEAATPGTTSITPGGMVVASGGVAAILIGVATALKVILPLLSSASASLSAVGIGLIIAAVVITVAGILATVLACVLMKQTSPETKNFNQGAYGEAQNKAQEDQTRVQTTQNAINQAFQQYISPDQDTKTQDANMVNAALKWLSSIVWTQRAA